MICPICEHPQERGAECDVCGARLAAAAPRADVPVPALPGLESNAITAAPAEGALPQPDGGGWLERTGVERVSVTAEPLEVERAVQDPGRGQRTPAPAVVCRYCRTPAAAGQRFCDRCGMRLQSYGGPSADPEPPPVRCRGCGTVVRGPLCPGCGARAPAAP